MQIGFNGRFFKENWRPALQEIEFGYRHGFRALQFQGTEQGVSTRHLGTEISYVGDALEGAGIVAVMEIVVRINASGRTASGQTPLDVLQANLPAIIGFPCHYVHWHLAAEKPRDPSAISGMEKELLTQFIGAVGLAQRHSFKFGFEHNEPNLLLLSDPYACAKLLNAVPQLGFVWDLNHTIQGHLDAFQALTPRMSMLHVSDTLLPEVNYHLPIGQGNIDFATYCQVLNKNQFDGPAILEIGGQPKYGGFGRDTDKELIESARRLKEACLGRD